MGVNASNLNQIIGDIYYTNANKFKEAIAYKKNGKFMQAHEKLSEIIEEIGFIFEEEQKKKTMIYRIQNVLSPNTNVENEIRGLNKREWLEQFNKVMLLQLKELYANAVYEFGMVKLKILESQNDKEDEYMMKKIFHLMEEAEETNQHKGAIQWLDQYECQISNLTYEYMNDFRVHVPKKYENSKVVDFNVDIVCMFFSWVVYEHRPRQMTTQKFSFEKGYKRLQGLGEWIITKCINIQEEKLKKSLNFHCQFAMNEEYGIVICAFRGTELNIDERFEETLKGWVTNLESSLVDCLYIPSDKTPKAMVHKGFYESYNPCKQYVAAQCDMYLKNGYTLYLTGHSQGAALATIAGVHLAETFKEYINQIKVVTFASPRVGNAAFADYFNEKYPNSPRYVTKQNSLVVDIVTIVPPELMGYKHVGVEKLIYGNSKYFGNPDPIPGINAIKSPIKNVLPTVGLHFPQVYLDGMLYEEPYKDEIQVIKDYLSNFTFMKNEETELPK